MLELTAQIADEAPLFDARYRWVILFTLTWLREVPGIDLDDPEQLDAAYGFMKSFVLEYVQRRGLSGRLDPMSVAAIADSPTARATVEKIFVRWMESNRDPGAKPPVQELVKEELAKMDPSLEGGELEARARAKRKKFARSFGLHARVHDVQVSPDGDVRLRLTFDEDIAFAPGDLKDLEINGVRLTSAQLLEIVRTGERGAQVQAVISVNAPPSAITSLRSLPMKVLAVTRDDVRLEAIKMA